MGLRFDQLTPVIFLAGDLTSSTTLGPYTGTGPGYLFAVTGMDAYPGVQPNNGDLQVVDSISGYVLWRVQQSANFPGPFSWRGWLPFNFSPVSISAEAAVPFSFLMWGVIVPDYTQDSFPF